MRFIETSGTSAFCSSCKSVAPSLYKLHVECLEAKCEGLSEVIRCQEQRVLEKAYKAVDEAWEKNR